MVSDAVHGYAGTLDTQERLKRFNLLESPAQRVIFGDALSKSGRKRIVMAYSCANSKRIREAEALKPLLRPQELLQRVSRQK